MGSRLLLAAMRLLSPLPLALQAWLGQALGRVAYLVSRSRRDIVLRNLRACFPEWSDAQRRRLARRHFGWLGRSVLERGLLWHASPARLRRLIRVEGDVGLAERSERPVMWLVPHFVGLDIAGAAVLLFQARKGVSIYQRQSDPSLDRALRRGRSRLGEVEIAPRAGSIRRIVRAVRGGAAFFNLPDMDFGLRDAAFVPFFGVPAATLLAPSRLARSLGMVVQPVIAEMRPGGQGYVVRFEAPWDDYPTADPLADAARMNAWIEAEVRRAPAQYLWAHRRFKTRPPGEPSFYDEPR